MKRILFKALLTAGLFVSACAWSTDFYAHVDKTKSAPPQIGPIYKCNGSIYPHPTHVTGENSNLGDCLSAAASYVRSKLPAKPKTSEFVDLGGGNSKTINRTVTDLPVPSPVTESGYSVGYTVVETVTTKVCSANSNGVTTCSQSTADPTTFSRSGSVQVGTRRFDKVCDDPVFPHMLFDDETQAMRCYASAPPLDCSKLKGMSTDGQRDYFWSAQGAYVSPEKPSCVTKCGTDSTGQKRCGQCAVVAKSFILTSSTGGKDLWRPVIGTLTGAACGQTEQQEPPKEPPKCWKTNNGLNMCQADVDEKCVTVNGVQQCESGCGFINNDFFCADTKAPPPKRKDDDKALPEPDDNITDPQKSINDMIKSDFKDVNRGVESRLAVVSTGIGNLENSVDTGNQILEQIESNTAESLQNDQAQLEALKGIESALGGDGDGECNPEKNPNCATDGDSGDPASWWNSVYPTGIKGIIDDKKAQFQASSAYEAMSEEVNIGTGNLAPWQFCFNSSVMNFGCFDVEIPPYVLAFVRLCILFGAAILCRRLLIGA